MKKLILIAIFFFNIFPLLKDDEITFFQVCGAEAQSSTAAALPQLLAYLQSLPNASQYDYSISQGAIRRVDLNNGSEISFINVSSYLNNTGFQQYCANQNVTLPPVSNEYPEEDPGIDWGEIGFELDNLRSQSRLDNFAIIEWWGSQGGFEPGNDPPPCTEDEMYTISFTLDFYEGKIAPPNATGNVFTLGTSSLPCANKFLIGGNIMQFNPAQASGISNYTFSDGSLYSVQFTNGDNYERAINYDVIENKMQFDSYSANCPDDYEDIKYKLINKRGSYQFVCFPNIVSLSGVESHTETGTSNSFYKGIPDNSAGYTFTMPDSTVSAANSGDQVLGVTSGGSYTCRTLDCAKVPDGTAHLDSCSKCVGGTTGKTACTKDCAGVWGGKSFLDSCNICADSIRKQPCDSIYKDMGDSLYAFLHKSEFQDSLNAFKAGFATGTLEKAISLGRDSVTNNFHTTGIRFATPGYSVDLIADWPQLHINTPVHFHPASAYFSFSAGDFYSLHPFITNPYYLHITSMYLYGADSSEFAMQIEDTALYANYVRLYPRNSTMGADNGFDTTKIIGKDFEKVYSQLIGIMSDEDALTQANAYIMSKYNTGLVMYRRKPSETRFSKINTKVTTSSTGNETYSTNNCY